MTKEKAIKKIKSYLIDYLPIEDYEEAEEIIEALEQKSCNDAISKASVFEIMGNLMSIPYDFDRPINEKDVSESMDKIWALPSVTPTRKKEEWISCDEKLPKPNEYVDNMCKYYLIQDEYGDMYVARYTKKGWNPIESLFFLDDVVAWRPLPKRYEYEGDNNDK